MRGAAENLELFDDFCKPTSTRNFFRVSLDLQENRQRSESDSARRLFGRGERRSGVLKEYSRFTCRIMRMDRGCFMLSRLSNRVVGCPDGVMRGQFREISAQSGGGLNRGWCGRNYHRCSAGPGRDFSREAAKARREIWEGAGATERGLLRKRWCVHRAIPLIGSFAASRLRVNPLLRRKMEP